MLILMTTICWQEGTITIKKDQCKMTKQRSGKFSVKKYEAYIGCNQICEAAFTG